MKRKYPVSFFLFGLLLNFFRYFLLGLIGLITLIVGIAGVPVCKIIGAVILACYVLLCVIVQFNIRSVSLKESDNPEFNKFMDTAFGVDDHDASAPSSRERIKKFVEDKIRSQKADLDK